MKNEVSNLMKMVAEHEARTTAGLNNLNSSVNQNGAACIKQTRQSEARLGQKIDNLSVVFDWVDYLFMIICAIFGGVVAWFFSRIMIAREMGPWVDRREVITTLKDAAGNITGFSTTATAEIIWPTTIILIVLFVLAGWLIGYLLCCFFYELEQRKAQKKEG